MVDTPKSISVGCVDDRVCIRIVGRGTFQNSQPVRQYALEMMERGLHEFVIDLGQCQALDSTFLGVLAGIGLRLRELGHASAAHVVNASARHAELLQTLGLDRLFDINAGVQGVPDNGHLHPLPDASVVPLTRPLTKDEVADLILEAHQNLIRTNKRNAPRFKELLQSIRRREIRQKHKE